MAHQQQGLLMLLRQFQRSTPLSLIRAFSTATSTSTAVSSSESPAVNKRTRINRGIIFARILALGNDNDTGGGERKEVQRRMTVASELQKLMGCGWKFKKADLILCIKDLRKYGRYQHCLEILEWIENSKSGQTGLTDRDHALRIDLISKLKGVDAAEKYFNSLAPAVQDKKTYGALLSCFCANKMTDKALALFEKMEEMTYASNELAFNNLMSLYLAMEQPEKVPHLVVQMKQRSIPLNEHTYVILIQSHASLDDLEGLEKVVDEFQKQNSIKKAWNFYNNVAGVFIKANQNDKAQHMLMKLEEILDNSDDIDRTAYHYMISLSASVGNIEAVSRVWDKLKSKFRYCNNYCYLTMLAALEKFNDIEGMQKILRQWDLSFRTYDIRVPSILISAYLKRDMLEEAKMLVEDAINKSPNRKWEPHVLLLDYYLEKGPYECALRHLALAVLFNWKPLPDKFAPFFEYFKNERDVDGAENLVQLFKKVQPLDAEAYSWLLKTYAVAGKTAPDMHDRMTEDGITLQAEHEELLDRVCPRS